MRRYELFEHTADIGFRAFGVDLNDAFGAAADTLFDIITDHAEIRQEESVEIEIESIDRQGLLVGLLSDLLVRFEADGLVLTAFQVKLESNTRLTATAAGEKFDASRHSEGYHVKGVSYHLMEIDAGDGDRPASVQVLLDV